MIGVIFDMDGTLLDTQRIYIDAWDVVGNEFGIANMGRLMPDVCGMSEHNWKAYLRNRFPTLDIEPFHTKVKDYIAAYGEVRFKAGAEQLLDFLKEKNIKIAIASGSGRELIEYCMNKLGALERFDVVVGGGDVKNGKPAPDIFLLAAEKLGIAPEDCFVMEDSKNGLLAAHRAGIRAIGIPDIVSFDEETKEIMFAELETLADAIELLTPYIG